MSSDPVICLALSDHDWCPTDLGVDEPRDGSNDHEMQRAQNRAQKRAGLRAVGQRVIALRRAKGWNRTTLARRAHVTVATVRGCEEGAKVTQPEKLQAIVDALGVPLRKLEADEADPRVRHWTDEDYEIGNWYHHAPRQLKHWLWTLQEIPSASHAIADPQLIEILRAWSALTQLEKDYVLQAFAHVRKARNAEISRKVDENADDAAAAPKIRRPQR